MKREIELIRTGLAVLLALAAIAVVVLTASGNIGPQLSPPELPTMTPPAPDGTPDVSTPVPPSYPGPEPYPEPVTPEAGYNVYLPLEFSGWGYP